MLWSMLWSVALGVVIVASLLPASDLPPMPKGADKLEHFLAYFVLAGGAVQLYARRRSWAIAGLLLVLVGIGLEYLQASMKLGRTLDQQDALANTLGVIAGLATSIVPGLRDALLRFDRRF